MFNSKYGTPGETMMKKFKISKIISIICSIIGLILSLLGLVAGLQSIGAPDFGGIGVIFILPSVIALLVILFDFLITLDKIKKGLIYSCINSIIKIGIIACFISTAISDYKYEIKFGVSNLNFDIIVILALTIVIIPSILNIKKPHTKYETYSTLMERMTRIELA